MVISMPLGWLLSYGAPLLYLFGLFFFILFGLLLGAAVYRVAAPGRPYSRVSLVVGTTLMVGVCWWVSLAKEIREIPTDMAEEVVRGTRDIGDRPVEVFRQEVAREIESFFQKHYPPGGMIGTVRWIVISGELRPGDVANLKRTIRREQRGPGWAIRVTLSIAMLGFGVGSQTFGLKSDGKSVQPSAGAAPE